MTQPAPIQIITRYVAGPPGPLAASVATLAALASLPPSGIPWPQGTPAFSQASGGTSWAWYPTGATPPAGATTTAGNGGLWVQQPSGPATLTAPTPAALSSLAPGSPYPAGTSAQVAAPFATWQLVTGSTLTPDGVTVVASSSAAGGGNWVVKDHITVPQVNTSFTVSGASVTYATSGLTAARTATIPTGCPLNAEITFADVDGSLSSGNSLTLSLAGGATINGTSGSIVLATAHMALTIKQVATNVWTVI